MKEISKDQLLNNFKELYSIEKKACDYYSRLLKTDIPNNDFRVIKEIRDDEKRHMKIVESILETINNEKTIRPKGIKL